MQLRGLLAVPNWQRIFAVFAALPARGGRSRRSTASPTSTSGSCARSRRGRRAGGGARLLGPRLGPPAASCCAAPRRRGLTDARIASLLRCPERPRPPPGELAAKERVAGGFRRVCKRVDTCAAEFPATTPYLYSTYGHEDEAEPDRPPQGDHPRLRAQPHRPGDRVRLLLRARGASRCASSGSRR